MPNEVCMVDSNKQVVYGFQWAVIVSSSIDTDIMFSLFRSVFCINTCMSIGCATIAHLSTSLLGFSLEIYYFYGREKNAPETYYSVIGAPAGPVWSVYTRSSLVAHD